jgi:hypothetical protein
MKANQRTVKVPDRVYDMITEEAKRLGIARSMLVDIAVRNVAAGVVTIAPALNAKNISGDVAIAGQKIKQRIKKK